MFANTRAGGRFNAACTLLEFIYISTMKLYGFNGTQRSFQVRKDNVYIEIEDVDYTIHDHYIEIHDIETSEPIDTDELAREMFECIDWAEVEKERYEAHLDLDELYYKENR